MPSEISWTPEHKNELRRLWCDELLTATEIASRTGRTRNAVLGTIHRMGLSNTRKAADIAVSVRAAEVSKRNLEQHNERNRQAQTIVHRRGKGPSMAKTPLPPPPALPPDGALNVSFADRRPDQCSMIVGEPTAAALCCGRTVQPGTNWCTYHRSIVYQPPALRVVSEQPRRPYRTYTRFGALRVA